MLAVGKGMKERVAHLLRNNVVYVLLSVADASLFWLIDSNNSNSRSPKERIWVTYITYIGNVSTASRSAEKKKQQLLNIHGK